MRRNDLESRGKDYKWKTIVRKKYEEENKARKKEIELTVKEKWDWEVKSVVGKR